MTLCAQDEADKALPRVLAEQPQAGPGVDDRRQNIVRTQFFSDLRMIVIQTQVLCRQLSNVMRREVRVLGGDIKRTRLVSVIAHVPNPNDASTHGSNPRV